MHFIMTKKLQEIKLNEIMYLRPKIPIYLKTLFPIIS